MLIIVIIHLQSRGSGVTYSQLVYSFDIDSLLVLSVDTGSLSVCLTSNQYSRSMFAADLSGGIDLRNL